MFGTLSSPGDFVKITQREPIKFATQMIGWVDEISGAGSIKKDFRWSTTSLIKGSWMELTSNNLSAIILNPNDDLYVDFRYTLLAGGPVTIQDVYLEYHQSVDSEDPYWGYRPLMLVSEGGNISNLTKIENFSFRPYQVNPAVVLYNELSYSINRLFGIDTMYARAVPMAVGRDIVLHEWTLFDVDDPCCVKVLVPNNEFPDSKINYSAMGLNFELPFEIHIVKQYFEEIFGVGTAPQKRDIIFFPLMNRIYEVESSYLWRDIMQTSVYWKVSLIKYSPKSNRYETQDFQNTLTAFTQGAERLFGKDIELEEEHITKPQQYDPKIGARFYDPIRLKIDDGLVIVEKNLQNYNLTISETQYDLRSIFNPASEVAAVKYREIVDFPEKRITTKEVPVCEGSTETQTVTDETWTEVSLCGWFSQIKSRLPQPRDNIKGSLTRVDGPIFSNIIFIIGAKRTYTVNDYVKISRFNGFSVYGQVQSITPISGGFQYTISVKNDIISFLNAHYPGWPSSSITSGYILEPAHEQILMNGWDISLNQGWKLSIWANRFFIYKSSIEEKTFILPNNLIDDSWYAFFFNLSNLYQQASLDVWIRKWSDTLAPVATTDLENIYSSSQSATRHNRSANINYNLPASNMLYTNIRLFNQIESDLTRQINILNQNIVKDSQKAIIIDNATNHLRLPYIGDTK